MQILSTGATAACEVVRLGDELEPAPASIQRFYRRDEPLLAVDVEMPFAFAGRKSVAVGLTGARPQCRSAIGDNFTVDRSQLVTTKAQRRARPMHAAQQAYDRPHTYSITRGLRAIMVGANDEPVDPQGFDGMLVEINSDIAILELEAERISTDRLLIGVEDQHGGYVFATLEIEIQVYSGGAHRVEGRFALGGKGLCSAM